MRVAAAPSREFRAGAAAVAHTAMFTNVTVTV